MLDVMSIPRHCLSSSLIAAAAGMVLLGTTYFASLRPAYSHLSNTISELGEIGAPQAHMVAFGFFLPVGLIQFTGVCLVCYVLSTGGTKTQRELVLQDREDKIHQTRRRC
jgi:hypothetical protein